MDSIEKTIIEGFLSIINKNEKKGHFSVKLLDTPEARKALGGSLPDYELYYNGSLIGAVEVKTKLVFIDKVVNAFRESVPLAYRFIIITDGKQAIVFDFSLSNDWRSPVYKDYLSRSLNSKLLAEREIKISEQIILSIREIIFKSIEKLVSAVKERELKKIIEIPEKAQIDDSYYIDTIQKEITTLSNQQDFKKNFEYILFNILVDSIGSKDLIYRYTTLDTVFNTINKATYRINGIQGMNDQSEGFHILKTIYGDGIEFEKSQDLANRFNQIFISSCSTSADNLTMWRLYGDNSKGVCLELEIIDDTKIPFFIKKVTYVQKDQQQILNILFNLTKQIERLGFKMKPELFSLILFFMKNNRYRVENEVRIVYDKVLTNAFDMQKFSFDWGIAEPFKILRPFVEISFLDDSEKQDVLPFRIKRIILGPNCPKEIRNELQFNTLITEKGLDYIRIEQSKIERDLYIG